MIARPDPHAKATNGGAPFGQAEVLAGDADGTGRWAWGWPMSPITATRKGGTIWVITEDLRATSAVGATRWPAARP